MNVSSDACAVTAIDAPVAWVTRIVTPITITFKIALTRADKEYNRSGCRRRYPRLRDFCASFPNTIRQHDWHRLRAKRD
ncbi:MAG: hypothetical protein IT353_09165 [Gemmatimonadaceae bacterium]|nr:hypothetical protein [Gemmatimonadaceae bacterium]